MKKIDNRNKWRNEKKEKDEKKARHKTDRHEKKKT